MKIRRFVAKDMRSALAQIKEELGVDAVIMSNKKIPEGVELMAAVDYSQSVPTAKPSAEPTTDVSRDISNDVVNLSATPVPQPQANTETHAPADSLSALLNRQVQQPDEHTQVKPANHTNDAEVAGEEDIEQQLRSFTERLRHSSPDGTIPSPHESMPDATSAFKEKNQEVHNSVEAQQMSQKLSFSQSGQEQSQQSSVSQQDFDKMQQEMASIRQLLEHQVSGLMWQDMAQKDPQRAVLVSRLLSLGLNEQIADQIAGYVPAQHHEAQAWQQATKLISEQINTTQNDIIHRGGVVALVGPTGVGKTTTIAKLAARFAQIHGHDNVALISTDTFRIAGFEQLATYGKIIGCQVKLAKDGQALDALLQQFSKKKLVLIDTAGMGQRDMRLAENLASLVSNARVRIRNYLVLAANSQQQVMQENVDRFKKVPLSGCIYTKLDESVSIGEIITTSIQNGLPIGYLTDGQRVPEDIKVANAEKLVTLADKMASKSQSSTPFTTTRPMPTAPAALI
ncbi:MAG: flagellar biosynthesis protein FlhF [Colwellia sp.]|nr:flagellar biosynthesis protein FlhF [Colwellia sp.]MCW8865050.1 flagellar biosynthesis protein FlhF [Colwellia sp.]MCW9081103.1 flagellar biosynthesis protein FlhF [Colwellia sp.]